MSNKDNREIARALASELMALADIPKCEWINEQKALEEFPFSLDMLRDMRGNGTLEFNHHWKYIKKPLGSRKKPSIIYHRQRMIRYVEGL
jgi:hypothetical protein